VTSSPTPPPADVGAEASLLGAAMLDTDALRIVAGLPLEVWYKPAHAHIADALTALHHRGEPADPVTVGNHITRAGLGDYIGGTRALVELMATCPATSNAAAYARIIVEHATKRALLGIAGEIAGIAANGHTAAEALEAARRLVDDLTDQTDASGQAPVRLTAASTIRVDRPAWAWEQRIPLAGVTLIPGREGEGKTALVGHIAARLTRGDLPGDRWGLPGDVVYIGHEDDRSTVLVPRLIAAGADLERFLFVDLAKGAPFALTVDTAALARQLAGRDVAAVVLDPLDAHLGAADSHKKADVQGAIAHLAGLTQLVRCAGMGIAHLNKGDARDVLLKVVGSVGLTTAVRSVLAVGAHPHHPDTEKVAVVRKANMTNAADVPAVRFRVEGTTIPHDDGGTITTARVVLLGEQTGIAADDILNIGDSEQRTALDEAADWLADVLAAGPMLKRDVTALARAEPIQARTLARAAERLSVVVDRDDTAKGRPSTWSLPDA
jgi:hypothetical protein